MLFARRAAVGAAAGVVSILSFGEPTLTHLHPAAAEARSIPKCWPTACSTPSTVPTVRLNTGQDMPMLGFGTYLTNGEELFDALVHALRNGYRLVDTAAGYYNERTVADAIEASGVPRSELFLTTKLWCSDHGRERTRRAIAQSLRALRTEYIDLYLIHAPDNQGETPEEIVRLRREAWEVLEEEHRAGRLRAIGVSNFEPRHIEQLLANRPNAVVPAVNQIELHPLIDQQETLDYCARKGIAVEAYGAIGADGLLEHPRLRTLASEYGRSEAQISLRHTAQRMGERGVVVLAKSLTQSRIDENLRAFDFQLDDGDARSLDALAKKGAHSYWDNSDVP